MGFEEKQGKVCVCVWWGCLPENGGGESGGESSAMCREWRSAVGLQLLNEVQVGYTRRKEKR